MQRMGGGSMPVCGSCPFPGTGVCDFYARGGKRNESCGSGGRRQEGGGCPCSAGLMKGGGGCGLMKGGSCPCSAGLMKGGATRKRRGGYRPTKKNLTYLKKWRKGESIGFTMTSSLKAKGLIPRTSRKLKGKKVVSRKYT